MGFGLATSSNAISGEFGGVPASATSPGSDFSATTISRWPSIDPECVCQFTGAAEGDDGSKAVVLALVSTMRSSSR